MIHRHLEIRWGAPAEELPSVAIVDILERGDLAAWQPIAAAVAREPFGSFAERVVRLVDAQPMYGLSLIHISEPTRQPATSRMPSSA